MKKTIFIFLYVLTFSFCYANVVEKTKKTRQELTDRICKTAKNDKELCPCLEECDNKYNICNMSHGKNCHQDWVACSDRCLKDSKDRKKSE